jgi:hypothetical protein
MDLSVGILIIGSLYWEQTRLSFEEWAGREIASHFSKACSQKAEWAVQDTLRPVFVREIQQRLREVSQVS